MHPARNREIPESENGENRWGSGDGTLLHARMLSPHVPRLIRLHSRSPDGEILLPAMQKETRKEIK